MFRDYSMQRCVIQREDGQEEICFVQRQVIIDVCFRERTRIQRRVVQRQDSHAEIQYVTIYS